MGSDPPQIRESAQSSGRAHFNFAMATEAFKHACQMRACSSSVLYPPLRASLCSSNRPCHPPVAFFLDLGVFPVPRYDDRSFRMSVKTHICGVLALGYLAIAILLQNSRRRQMMHGLLPYSDASWLPNTATGALKYPLDDVLAACLPCFFPLLPCNVFPNFNEGNIRPTHASTQVMALKHGD
jgi:hypothetical protein